MAICILYCYSLYRCSHGYVYFIVTLCTGVVMAMYTLLLLSVQV